MQQRVACLFASIALVMTVLILSPAHTRADSLVRLTHWEGPAVLERNLGPGVEYYSLIARAQGDRRVAAQGKFSLRVILPNGQTETRVIPDQEVSARRLTVLVRTTAVRNLRPEQVVVRACVLDAATCAQVTNDLTATIADFPQPKTGGATADPGPFGWGEPLPGPSSEARRLPRPGPDGFTFVRIPATDASPGFFLADGEATNAQVARRLTGYDPRAGRSDEFTLEDPAQPAVGLTPKRAEEYLAALGKADPSGVSYRLPTQAEWLRASRAGKSSSFWWGDDATYPAGANLLGPEPTLPNDTTAPARTPADAKGFEPNPWGLYHTFGNLAEWAKDPGGNFVRMGGHFRTEPASPLPEVPVENAETTGPDPYVGVRPAFDLTAESGAELVRKALQGEPGLADLKVAFDPDRATATLTGSLAESSLRRAADRRLEPLWFLAAVENQVVTPTVAPGQLATLGGVVGPVRRVTPLGRWHYEVPVSVLWADRLPVRGSEWWVNVYPACGGHFAHKLIAVEPNDTRRLSVVIDRSRVISAGRPVDAPVSVALSLGAPAPSRSDPHVVSNVETLLWKVP